MTPAHSSILAGSSASGSPGTEPLAACVDLELCGEWHCPELAAVRRWFDGAACDAPTPSLAQLIDRLVADGRAPELIVCAQSHPRTVGAEEIDRLGRAAPLARLALVVGPWCEGEGRTGPPPVGVTRLFWHEAPAWRRAVGRTLALGKSPPWSYPGAVLGAESRSWSPAERQASPQGHLFHDASKLAAIGADSLATYEALAATVGALGYRSCWQRGDRFVPQAATTPIPSAGLWDGGDLGEREFAELTQFCRRLQRTDAGVLVLVDFPRAHHVEQIAAAGAAALLGKPYRISALADALNQLAASEKRGDPFSNGLQHVE